MRKDDIKELYILLTQIHSSINDNSEQEYKTPIHKSITSIINNTISLDEFLKNYDNNSKYGTYLRVLKNIYRYLEIQGNNFVKLYSYLDDDDCLTGAIEYAKKIICYI